MLDQLMPELRAMVWAFLPHSTLCRVASVCRAWNEEVKSNNKLWQLRPVVPDPASVETKSAGRDFLFNALLDACPELGEGLEWYEWRSFRHRLVLEDMRVSEFAFLQAARYAINAHPEDAQGMKTTFMNLAQRMFNLPNPHPQYRIGYADDFLAVLGRQLLLCNDAEKPEVCKLLKLWKLLPKILEEFRKTRYHLLQEFLDNIEVREMSVRDNKGEHYSISVLFTPAFHSSYFDSWITATETWWPRELSSTLLSFINEHNVDTHQVAKFVSMWTMTLAWPLKNKTASIRLTLNQYAVLSALHEYGAKTCKELAHLLMIPADYLWVTLESLFGFIIPERHSTSSILSRAASFMINPEFNHPGEGEVNFAEKDVRLRHKYMSLPITPKGVKSLQFAYHMRNTNLQILSRKTTNYLPHRITSLSVCIRNVDLCHCCYSCRICELSVFELCPHCAALALDQVKMQEACFYVQYTHLHCLARNPSEIKPNSKLPSPKVMARLAQEPLPDGAHLQDPAGLAWPNFFRQIGKHAHADLGAAGPILFPTDRGFTKGWQQKLQEKMVESEKEAQGLSVSA